MWLALKSQPLWLVPSLVHLLLLVCGLVHELRQEVDGQREDDGGVLLGRDGVEGLERTNMYRLTK